MLLLDIDHFKRVNDTYGHDVGDEVLIHFSKTVVQTLRAEEDLVRLGGEEFAIVLPGTSVESSISQAECIRKVVESTPLKQGDRSIEITVSIGVVHNSCSQEFNLDKILVQGDRCLYDAKEGGRNRVICTEMSPPEKR